jgi:uncharacterized glyoxalase superfamily protein PhnB
MSVKTIPEGFHTVTPYLMIKDAPRLLSFLREAFGAKEIHRTTAPDGTIACAAAKVGGSMVMVSEAPADRTPFPAQIYLYVPDTDAVYRQALKAGASSILEPVDQFYGDRNAGVTDPAGNNWWIATHYEDVSDEEMSRRMAQHRR